MFVMWNCESVSSEQKAVSSWRPFAFNGSSPCDLSDPPCLCGKRSLNNFTTEARRTTERHREISRNRRAFVLLLTAYCLLLTTSCRRDMQDQPKTIAYRESSFYKDGTGSRPLIDGAVPRGYLREDREYYFGKKPTAFQPGTTTQPGGAQATAPTINLPMAPASATNPYPDDVDAFPFPITKEALDRGEERYNIYCSVCHGMTGYGDGM